jgi:hypothetical protein
MKTLRAKVMLPAIKELITVRALSEPSKSREKLADEIIQQVINDYPAEVPPAWETVIKLISKARNHEPSPLDKPWHLGTLKDYPLPLEALPYVLGALESQNQLARHRELTIRQAFWISRLYNLAELKDYLWELAWHYAFHERISEISRTAFDTSEYDRMLSYPKELLEYFKRSTPGIDFKTYKKAFEPTTGIEHGGASFPVDFMVLKGEKILAPLKVKNKHVYLELPFTDSKALVDRLEKEKQLKFMSKIGDDTTLIVFKKPVSLEFDNREFNESLYNLIKGDQKPEDT